MRRFLSIFSICSLLALLACTGGVAGLSIDKLEPEQAAAGETVQIFLSGGEFELATNSVFVGEQQAELVAAPGLVAEGTGVVGFKTGLVGEAEQAEENAITIRIPEAAAPGQVFIRVLGDNFASNQFPFTVLAEDGELAEAAAEVETEKAAPAPVCDWSGSTFFGNPVYKSETAAQPDQSTELYWTIEGKGDCGKFKVIVETAPGVITEFKDDQAQNGKLIIDKHEEDTTYKLIVVQNGQAVYQLTETVEVITIEEDFKVSVEVINNKTGTETVLLNPENNYEYENKWTFSYVFDSRLEKLCIRSPHFGVVQNALSLISSEQKESGVWPKFPMVVSKKGECFTPQNSQIDADGNYYGTVEDFKFDPSINHGQFRTKVKYYAVYKGDKVFKKSFPVSVAALKPSIDVNLARAIMGEAEDEETTDPKGWESRWLELKIAASHFGDLRLVVSGAPRLYGNSKVVNFEHVELKSVCHFGGKKEIEYQEGVCAQKGFKEQVLKHFSKKQIEKTLQVYRINAADFNKTLYIYSTLYKTKVLAFGYGTGTYKENFVIDEDEVRLPKPAFYARSCKKNQVFKTQGVSFGLDSKAWVVGAVGEPTVESNDLKDIASSFSTPADSGDGYYDIDSISAEYNGMNPWFKIKAKGILGDTHTFTCGWGKKIKHPVITVKLADIATCDDSDCNYEKISLTAKIKTPLPAGPAAFTHWRFKVASACRIDKGEGNVKIFYSGSKKLKQTFTIGHVGLDCWQVRFQVRDLDGKWRYVRYKNPTLDPAKKDYVWKMSKVGKMHPSANISFPPVLVFDKKIEEKTCGLFRHSVDWSIKVEHVAFITGTAPCSGWDDFKNIESDTLIVHAQTGLTEHLPYELITCKLTAVGPGWQVKEIELKSKCD